MSKPLVVVGAGGFGREVLDVVDAINSVAAAPRWNVVGVLDDAPSTENLERLRRRRVVYLGPVEAGVDEFADVHFVIGIGSPPVRRRIAAKCRDAGWSAATLVHPAATLGFDVKLGVGTVVCAGVRLTTNIHSGRHVHLNPNATIGHDTHLGDFVSMNPASSVSGDCAIGDGVLVGVGAVILNGLTVGTNATVGAASCVVSDVPAGVIVKGVPAK